ncbi:ShET2/EspL2 family type III secretion system effector toxin [Candidatus Ichthyocystis sparus]|uniref:ShET2/EspL2 family type III secretion system effector toxin n=1 Tax=Candidatus Ichthyocystis sparus TaxID=1561004 RepID=UPI000B84FB73|nr:ShET2/EspL2 family type III secretion system effector toxin [Candidatus Ichthyocystis sparus]
MCVGFSQAVRIYAHSGYEIFPDCKIGPYISPRGTREVVNFNGNVKVSGQLIFCTHLSSLFMLHGVSCYAKGKRIKVNSLFASEDSIVKVTPSNIKYLCKNVFERSCGRYIIPCNSFGNFLYKISTRMAPNEQRFFLLESSNHSMSFIISRKVKESAGSTGNNTWVVNFFDPNKTNVTSRSEVYYPTYFLNSYVFSLRMFIDSYLYGEYFFSTSRDIEDSECIVYEYSDKAGANFKYSTLATLSQYNVSACMVYHMMYDEYASFCLRDIVKRINLCVNEEVRKQIFFARNIRGTPALYVAMEQGKAQSVKAYNYLLQALSRDEQISLLPELLSSKNCNGTPALFIAMQYGHAKCVSSYAVLLESQLKLIRGRVSADNFADIVVSLLLGKRDNEISSLLVGLNKNNADAVGAYANVLDRVFLLDGTVSDDKLADIVFNLISSPVPYSGETTVFLALDKGSASSICAIALLIDRLLAMKGRISHDKLADMIYKLLSSTDKNGTCGLFISLKEGKSDAVLSFGYLIDKLLAMRGCVSDEKLAAMVFDLLMAKNGKGIPGLFVAMKNGCAGAVGAFGKLLGKITLFKGAIDNGHFNRMLIDIVASRLPDGTPGLFVALDNNLSSVIGCYSSLLAVIPEDKLIDILVASNRYGIPGTFVTDEETLDAYLSMLSLFPGKVIQGLCLKFKRIRKSIDYMFLVDGNLDTRYNFLLSRLRERKLQISDNPSYNARCLLM